MQNMSVNKENNVWHDNFPAGNVEDGNHMFGRSFTAKDTPTGGEGLYYLNIHVFWNAGSYPTHP